MDQHIAVWPDEFCQDQSLLYQVSLNTGERDSDPIILSAHASRQAAWEAAIRQADTRGLSAYDEITGTHYEPEPTT